MSTVLWIAIGITIGAGVLHATLGVRRPLDRTYLSFACIMALLAVFLFMQTEIYAATSPHAAVEATRRQLVVVHAFMACLLVFVRSYTRVPLPRLATVVLWGGLVVLGLVNLVAPDGLWYSGPPQIVAARFRSEPYNTIVAPPMGALQWIYALYGTSLLVTMLVSAAKMYRRGERQRALSFGVAVFLILIHNLVDVVRDNVGGSWPYLGEFGVVTWGLIMSVQLAHDYRAQARALSNAIVLVEAQSRCLASILESMRALEQNMEVPLHTLELGVAALTPSTAEEHALLARLRRAVKRLREFSRSMPDSAPAARVRTTGSAAAVEHAT